nr:DUF192 domain-containing protein [Roseitranquillus sediminis]
MLAVLVALAGPAAAACDPGRVELRGDWGVASFGVEIADDPAERAQGLMHRESLPASRGMLFVYEQPQNASFWMRNTLIPLDMIFADETGRVTHVHENAVPLDETPIPGGSGVLAVLEINGGMARRLGIEEGTELRHPALDQSIAAWPCD